MIEVFFYSIADKKVNQVVSDTIQVLLDSEYVPVNDKNVLKHCLEVAKEGMYPSKDYFNTFYSMPAFTYNNLAEIVTYANKVIDFYKTQYLQKSVLGIINESTSSSEFLAKLDELSNKGDRIDEDDAFEMYRPILYSEAKDKPETKGIMCGVPEIDELTNGFQEGSVASICAFTGQGKSTMTVSTLFRNALEGKKCLLVSLEMAPEIIWPQFQARYLYQCKGMSLNFQDILMHKLTQEQATQVDGYDDDFKEQICKNLMIIDELVLSKSVVTSAKSIQRLLRKCEKQLGGLDLIAFDHVGQFELLFPEMGNVILKQIQSAIKTYACEDGHRPACIWCVQCNREGYKLAQKNGGKYAMTAIADLNEVERSSSYILFMYTSDDDKLSQETHMTLTKHRLGAVLSDPVVTTFNPGVSTVGQAIDKISLDDGDFNALGNDFNFDMTF